MKQFPVMTAVMALLIVIAAGVGGAVVIWGPPGALSFEAYLDDLKVFAFAVAGLGAARGIAAGASHIAEALKQPSTQVTVATTPPPTDAAPAPKPARRRAAKP